MKSNQTTDARPQFNVGRLTSALEANRISERLSIARRNWKNRTDSMLNHRRRRPSVEGVSQQLKKKKVMLIKANTIRATLSECFEPFELVKFSGLNRLARRKVTADRVSMNFVTPWKANQILSWDEFQQLIRLRVQLK
jgi:hypothetical protein